MGIGVNVARALAGKGGMLSRMASNRRAQTFSEDALKGMTASIGQDRKGLGQLRDSAFLAGATSEAREGRRLRANAGSAVAQQFAGVPTTFGGALETALRRSKARQKIEGQGEGQLAQQGLKNRIEQAKWSRAREGELVTAMGQARNIREGVNIGVSDANALDKASRYSMYGNIAGSLTGVFANKEGRQWVSDKLGSIFKPKPQQQQAEPDWDDFKG